MLRFQTDHYYLYREITELLRSWTREYPEFTRLYSIGTTGEGRDILCLEIALRDETPAEQKAGLLMDGALHGAEVLSSSAVLLFAEEFLRSLRENEANRDFLRTSVLYLIPRINADGSELCLTTPEWARGSANPYFPPDDGIRAEDINGDGEILQMRLRDPNGTLKCSLLDSRIMIPAEESDPPEVRWSVYREGMVYGAVSPLRDAMPRRALDPNRQFPYQWSADSPFVMQFGRKASGPEPLFEPEVRAIYDFIRNHPNLVAIHDCHSFGGIHFSPYTFCPENEPIPEDAAYFRQLAEAGAAVTGYQISGIFPEGFQSFMKGAYTTWAYFQEGVNAWSTELWSYLKEADPGRGSERTPYEETEQDSKKVLDWDDRNNNGRGFAKWTPFLHPQLGEVELGGWRDKTFRYNPPTALIERECRKAAAFSQLNLEALPQLELVRASAEKQGNRCSISAEIRNAGLFPTSGSRMAERLGTCGKLTAVLSDRSGVLATCNPEHLPGGGCCTIAFALEERPEGELSLTISGQKVAPLHISLTLA